MPLRFNYFPTTARLRRHFNTTTIRRDSPKPTHYETLEIPTNATPSEVKKSFYTLSKTHHPDRNPNDPSASHRFVQISEAYAILGTPAKRQAYDREHLSHSHSHHHSPPPQGSYHSSGPAGGRPASGLSRRRTQFRGPPPSFYRSGGWGAHSAKRQAAQNNDAETGGGMGPGQSPWGQVNDVPHFDREGHTRTHENNTRRWARRKGMEDGWIPEQGAPRGMLANFLFVSGIISLGILVPSLMIERVMKGGNRDKNL
ncbi:DnaJ-domain-containing protein [Mollisia scopiformis]|uniref:DnaJ-domain-containing protein n=1 Tax=Mollisia scopiformis TaxID=149040 RepID=A0A194WW03_MOLSC|nr:DnaJ-domain-containing protein [Mollisia scopiformis]KUJ12143.1 DnaJ-domain-containing protein [Mollisia scopiformis]